jgi:hypothetical protein
MDKEKSKRFAWVVDVFIPRNEDGTVDRVLFEVAIKDMFEERLKDALDDAKNHKFHE